MRRHDKGILAALRVWEDTLALFDDARSLAHRVQHCTLLQAAGDACLAHLQSVAVLSVSMRIAYVERGTLYLELSLDHFGADAMQSATTRIRQALLYLVLDTDEECVARAAACLADRQVLPAVRDTPHMEQYERAVAACREAQQRLGLH